MNIIFAAHSARLGFTSMPVNFQNMNMSCATEGVMELMGHVVFRKGGCSGLV